jgi:hypothetical protein
MIQNFYVDAPLATGPNADSFSGSENKVFREGVDNLTLSVNATLQLPLANVLFLGAMGIFQNDEFAFW